MANNQQGQQQGQDQRTSNDDRSDTLNPNNTQRQAAVDEHSRRLDPQNPNNQGGTRNSNLPGQGGRRT
jgi:hypothetical protein